MRIQLNGEDKAIAVKTIQQLVDELGLGNKRIAVEHNLEIVMRSQWQNTFLAEGDRLEIVHAIGGG